MSEKPEIHVIHGMEFVCKGMVGKFRSVTGACNPAFRIPNLYYNKFIALSGEHLVVRKDNNHVYKIRGYMDDSIIVENDKAYGFLQVFCDGTKGEASIHP